jgi:hypothetical protein
MNRALSRICIFVIALAVTPLDAAKAAVFERDWKTPGDGLLTYDDVSQREWLDLPVSLLDQFPGMTIEDRYQSAILEIAPGGLFDGFAVANRTDIVSLATSAGIDTTTTSFTMNGSAVSELIF